jgi:hypothetical protein
VRPGQVSGRDGLVRLLASLEYRPGWEVRYEADLPDRWCAGEEVQTSGPTLCVVTAPEFDARRPEHGRIYRSDHYFPVPESCGDWPRWVLDRLLDVEAHEAMEFLKVGGEHPFAPAHSGPGPWDPYAVRAARRATVGAR